MAIVSSKKTVSSPNGTWIRSKREALSLSQAKMARFLSIPQYLLSGWETEKEPIPNEYLGLLENFFKDFENKKNKGEISLKKIKTDRTFSYSKKFSISDHMENFLKETDDSLGLVENEDLTNDALKPKAIALFAGIGGMSLGLKEAGFNVIGHVEIDTPIRKIYEKNFPRSKTLGTDIKGISDSEVRQWKKEFGDIEILAGGPPCQGFSLAGKRNVFDPRNQLFNEFARIAGILKPRFIMLENVRTLTSMTAPDGTLIKDHLLEAFSKVGYVCEYKTINAAEYGIPQSRERVIFLGVRKEQKDILKHIFPAITHGGKIPYRTFEDATRDLEILESGEKSSKDMWHFAIAHPDHVIKMLKNVPQGKSAHDNEDPKMRPTSGFNTTYKRLKMDEPSSTISTNFSMISGSRNVHPINTRALTIREAMRCQTFPDSFLLQGKAGDIRRGIGNAVPPSLAKVIGLHLKKLGGL